MWTRDVFGLIRELWNTFQGNLAKFYLLYRDKISQLINSWLHSVSGVVAHLPLISKRQAATSPVTTISLMSN